MARLSEDQLQTLASRLAAGLEVDAPGWTDRPDDDPGVTLLQAFAFLAEELVFRATRIPDRSNAVIEQTMVALATLRRPAYTPWGNVTRVRYYAGQLLTAQDFQAEQDYVRARHRIHNRWLLGAGVVSGLRVTVAVASSDSGPVVSVEPGCAIAPDGEELVVSEALTCALSAPSSWGFVTLRYVERPVEPAPVTGTPESEASRIEERVALDFENEMPSDRVAIARVVRGAVGWQIDPHFQPATVRWPNATVPPAVRLRNTDRELMSTRSTLHSHTA